MAKKSKVSRLSSFVNTTGFAIDVYNQYAYQRKNITLHYTSLAITTLGSLLDFYLAIKSPRKIIKIFSICSAAFAIYQNVKRFRLLKQRS